MRVTGEYRKEGRIIAVRRGRNLLPLDAGLAKGIGQAELGKILFRDI